MSADPAPDVVTTSPVRTGCQPGSRFCPENGVIPATGGRRMATARVLQMLLAMASLMMVGGALLLVIRDVVLGSGPDAGQIVVTGALAAVAALLYLRPRLSMGQLRALELATFGGLALYLAFAGYRAMLEPLAAGDAGMALSLWHRTILHIVVLVVAYALFVPSPWWRTGLVVAPIAGLPFVLGAVLWLRHPEYADVTARVVTGAGLLDAAFVVLTAAALAVAGSVILGRFFDVAYEAREANLYHFKERIGTGGMGEVWLAEHQALARPTAVKLIRKEMVGNGDPRAAERALRRFEREARATAGLRSPHTVEVYDFGVTGDGTFFYAMEYLEGIDLDTLVKKYGPVPAERAVSLLLQACDSLADAHARGLVHRDIKPANLHVSRLGLSFDWVKVLDFGLVKQDTTGGNGDLTSLTGDGLTSGTPMYMAPEMALGRSDIDGRADLYALGCVGYWLLTGRPVFAGDTHVAVLVEHVKTEPLPPSRRTELPIPEELDRVILKCLAKEPGDRFQSAEELAAALAEVPLESTWSAERAREWWNLHMPRMAA